jgi:oxygen-independent coproporphyrinogen III oxidase
LAGIYLHIPFCRQACTYCNFHFSTSLRLKKELITAMVKEIEAEKKFLNEATLNTIYFGGGTPSLLETAEIETLITEIKSRFPVDEDAEITLEANPDDISKEKLKSWKQAGITRLSIGVQSFFEQELKWMNRAHTAEQSKNNLKMAREEFDNITMDLIYGSPLLTDEMWKYNVDLAISYDIPHLSCYALTVEEKTPLSKSIRAGGADIENEKQARQFLMLMQWLRDAGYEHYEVSNFAKPGYRSRHNSSYWKAETYLGIGPSAHSYDGSLRRWNVANNSSYIAGIKNGDPARETEVLTDQQKMNEYIMISLRTREGLNLEFLEQTWGVGKRAAIERQLKRFTDHALVNAEDSFARLTDQGMLRADGIAAALFD